MMVARGLWLLLPFLLWTNPGLAGGCVCRERPLSEQVREATLIFQGVVVYPDPLNPPAGSPFSADMILKGVSVRAPVVQESLPGGNPACAISFELNRSYQVMALGTYESGYYTDACMSHPVPSDPQDTSWLAEIARLRTEQGAAYTLAHPDRIRRDGLELEKIRSDAEAQLAMDNPELALRLYVRAAQLSRNSALDLLGQGRAYLMLMMARLALERFDDVLEKDNSRQDAWSGRYQALGLLDRWREVPEKADLTGFVWHRVRLSTDLVAPVFAKGWWDAIDASQRKLVGADFSATLLTDVDFSAADLERANFRAAELRGVNFSGANLRDADFTQARLSRIRWNDQTVWPQGFNPGSIGQQDAAGR